MQFKKVMILGGYDDSKNIAIYYLMKIVRVPITSTKY